MGRVTFGAQDTCVVFSVRSNSALICFKSGDGSSGLSNSVRINEKLLHSVKMRSAEMYSIHSFFILIDIK